MVALKLSIVLAIFAFASAGSLTATGKDAATIANVVKCVQQKMKDGVPELNIPSFDPFLYDNNVTFGAQFTFLKFFFILSESKLYYLQNFTNTFTQVSSDDDKVAHLKFHARLPLHFFNATWTQIEDFTGTDSVESGLMYMYLHDFEFDGEIKIEKPLLSGKITDLKISNNKVGEIKIQMTNMKHGDLFAAVFQVLWRHVFTSAIVDSIAAGLVKNLVQKWLDQPEQLQQLLSGCSI